MPVICSNDAYLAFTDNVLPFNDEQLRLAANVRQYYGAWCHCERALRQFVGYLSWKTIGGRDYRYRTDSHGHGTSLGPRSPGTEHQFAKLKGDRKDAADRVRAQAEQLKVAGAMYRTLRLPAIASAAAEVLREADRRRMLGEQLIVVGTRGSDLPLGWTHRGLRCRVGGARRGDGPGDGQTAVARAIHAEGRRFNL
jgi:hypothetical protein